MKSQYQNELSQNLEENKTYILRFLGNGEDVKVRELKIDTLDLKGICMFIDGISNSDTIEDQIIKPLRIVQKPINNKKDSLIIVIDHIETKTVKTTSKKEVVIDEMINGNTIILIEGFCHAIVSDTTKWPEKSLEKPFAQRSPKGPNVGFTESLSQNIALIRKTLRDPKLRVESNVTHQKVKTKVNLLYIEGKIQSDVLQEIKEKLKIVETEVLLDSSYLEELMTGEILTNFPLTISSDRPDVICSNLLEGKAAIIVDGSPFIIALPAVFTQFFQSPDDYYTLTKGMNMNRLLRLLFLTISVLLPAGYIAFTIHHPGLVPNNLLISIVGQREQVPFPTILEVTIFYLFIIVITESSLRLPQTVILTVSVFGGIILGQSAVDAQLVQPTTLVVVSASYILGSVLPIYSLRPIANRLILRFLILAGLLGLYGIILGLVFLFLHLSSLRSFGVPYLSPIAPFNLRDQRDNLIREDLDNIMNNEKKFILEEPTKKTK